MPRVNMVKKARKAKPEYGIEIGDAYYWWKFRYGGTHYSKTYPKRQQLTQSSFLISVYDIEDALGELSNCEDSDDLRSSVDSILSDIESLKDECQDSLDNMPEQLQEGSKPQERVEALEAWYGEIEAVSLDFDDDSLEIDQDTPVEDLDIDPEKMEKASEEERKALIEEARKAEARKAKVQEIADELSNTSCESD